MFGPKLTKIFASRWAALWWSASILFMVWQFMPGGDDDGNGGAAAPTAAANPWAKDPQ